MQGAPFRTCYDLHLRFSLLRGGPEGGGSASRALDYHVGSRPAYPGILTVSFALL